MRGGGTGLLHPALVPSWSPSSCCPAPARLWGHESRLGHARNPKQLGCREGRNAVPGITQQPLRHTEGRAQSPQRAQSPRRVPAPPWGQGDASPTMQGIPGCCRCLSGEFASTWGHAVWCGVLLSPAGDRGTLRCRSQVTTSLRPGTGSRAELGPSLRLTPGWMKLGPHQVGQIHPLPLFAEILLLFPNAGATRGCSTSAPAGAGAQRPTAGAGWRLGFGSVWREGKKSFAGAAQLWSGTGIKLCAFA